MTLFVEFRLAIAFWEKFKESQLWFGWILSLEATLSVLASFGRFICLLFMDDI